MPAPRCVAFQASTSTPESPLASVVEAWRKRLLYVRRPSPNEAKISRPDSAIRIHGRAFGPCGRLRCVAAVAVRARAARPWLTAGSVRGDHGLAHWTRQWPVYRGRVPRGSRMTGAHLGGSGEPVVGRAGHGSVRDGRSAYAMAARHAEAPPSLAGPWSSKSRRGPVPSPSATASGSPDRLLCADPVRYMPVITGPVECAAVLW